MQLAQVHVLFRHGARTPLSVRHGSGNAEWLFCGSKPVEGPVQARARSLGVVLLQVAAASRNPLTCTNPRYGGYPPQLCTPGSVPNRALAHQEPHATRLRCPASRAALQAFLRTMLASRPPCCLGAATWGRQVRYLESPRAAHRASWALPGVDATLSSCSCDLPSRAADLCGAGRCGGSWRRAAPALRCGAGDGRRRRRRGAGGDGRAVLEHSAHDCNSDCCLVGPVPRA